MKTVVAFGTFDIIHPGHIHYLSFARTLGDRLFVVVTPDAAVIRRKGSQPLFTQKERSTILKAIGVVDRVLLGDADDSWQKVLACNPDIACFGYDQKQAARAFKDCAALKSAKNIPVVMAPALQEKRYHSRKIKLNVVKNSF